MSKLLEDIATRFTGRLHGRIEKMRGQGFTPTETAWIGKLLIFFSLENCRPLIETPNKTDALCRFSMGQPKGEDLKKLREMEQKIRGRNFLKKGAKKLSEYMVDFTFSNLAIEQALGLEAMPEGRNDEKFQLLLACESESSTKDAEVLWDFMKLIDIKAPVKVMIFQARGGDGRGELETKFKDVLRRHSMYERDRKTESQWLFIGNPGYREWMDNWDNPKGLTRQIDFLDTSTAEPKFVNRDDLWSWDVGPETEYQSDYEE